MRRLTCDCGKELTIPLCWTAFRCQCGRLWRWTSGLNDWL